MKKRMGTLDLEPTWKNIVENMLCSTNVHKLRPELLKIAEIADLVRQAQKRGDKKITFDLSKNDIKVVE